jgi:transglutaminase-like putative cysteine protease
VDAKRAGLAGAVACLVAGMAVGWPLSAARAAGGPVVLNRTAYYVETKTVVLTNTGTAPAERVTADIVLLPPAIAYAAIRPIREAPKPSGVHRDRYGNLIARFVWPRLAPNHSVRIVVQYQVAVSAVRYKLPAAIPSYPRDGLWRTYTSPRLEQAAVATDSPALRRLDRRVAGSAMPAVQKARRYFAWIVEHIRYSVRSAPAGGALAVLKSRTGICTDFADLFTGMLRTAGIPARLVDGYVVNNGGGQGGFHQWVEWWIPSVGWVASDPTWGLDGDFLALTDNWHIPLYVGIRPDVSVAWQYAPGTLPYVAIRYHYAFAVKSAPPAPPLRPLPVLSPNGVSARQHRAVPVERPSSSWWARLWRWFTDSLPAWLPPATPA